MRAIVEPESQKPGTTVDPDPADASLGSLEDLYIRHAPESIRLAFLMTSDGPLAEDLVQEAFIKVAGRFRHLRDANAFDAYLRRTVVNLCTSHHRHRRVERDYVAREASRPPASVAPPDIGDRDELRAALATLPLRQRAAVVLRYYLDLPEQQVAQTLGCSVTAARSLVFRAMETLRAQISRGDDT